MPSVASSAPTSTAAPSVIGVLHRRRLREIWRSAGWPRQDAIEIELLATGLLERRVDGSGRETLRVSDARIGVLAATLQRNRAARDRHEALVARVALQLQRAGRIAWCGLSLRSLIADGTRARGERWQLAMPDVFSVRHTTVAAYLQSAVHEIKVRRADLLSDLRHADKRAAYLAMAGECWYVLAEGVAEPEEVPVERDARARARVHRALGGSPPRPGPCPSTLACPSRCG